MQCPRVPSQSGLDLRSGRKQMPSLPRYVSSPLQSHPASKVKMSPLLRNSHIVRVANDLVPKEEVLRLQQQVQQMEAMLSQMKKQLNQLAPGHDMASTRDTLGNPKRMMTKADWELLPDRFFIVRHGQSRGNTDMTTYGDVPDNKVSLTPKGKDQSKSAGLKIREVLTNIHNGPEFKLYFLTSPYCRALQTCQLIADAFQDHQVAGVRQAVQLREQDFGNFQDPDRIKDDLKDRMRFGRFWYRFHGGESGADVYDRMTIFEDHLTRDMMNGRFAGTSVVLVTHGLTLRIFLMRWFHWTVDEFLQVWNPKNATPIIIEKMPWEEVERLQDSKYVHVKHVYHVTSDQLEGGSGVLRGVTPSMVSYVKRVERGQLMLNPQLNPQITAAALQDPGISGFLQPEGMMKEAIIAAEAAANASSGFLTSAGGADTNQLCATGCDLPGGAPAAAPAGLNGWQPNESGGASMGLGAAVGGSTIGSGNGSGNGSGVSKEEAKEEKKEEEPNMLKDTYGNPIVLGSYDSLTGDDQAWLRQLKWEQRWGAVGTAGIGNRKPKPPPPAAAATAAGAAGATIVGSLGENASPAIVYGSAEGAVAFANEHKAADAFISSAASELSDAELEIRASAMLEEHHAKLAAIKPTDSGMESDLEAGAAVSWESLTGSQSDAEGQ